MPLPPRPPPKKRAGPPEVTPEQVRDRARGALLGLACGDALGTTHEFKRLGAPPFPMLAEGPLTDMRGFGPFNLKPGQVTDDTQMACCLAEQLALLGRYDGGETAKAYVRWLPHAFDVGVQTRATLEAIRDGKLWDKAGRHHWFENGRRPAGNGSLMRVAPLGVFFAFHQQERIEACLLDAQVTHFSPICQLAGVVACAVVSAGIKSAKNAASHDEILAAIEADLSIGAATLGQWHPDVVQSTQDAAQWLRADVAAARDPDPMLYGPELHLFAQEGYVRVCLRLALWELFHAPSLEAGLVDVVNRGGDTDTNGAVAGALLGAVHGEAAIPQRWTDVVLQALGAGPPSLTPLWTKYHPRLLLELVEKMKEKPKAGPKPALPPLPKKPAPGGH